MFERFTDRARRALVLAGEEARLLDHNFLGTEHLLLGLLREGNGVAAKALIEVGASLESVRDMVEETIGTGPGAVLAPPFTPRTKKVLELSLREALQLGHNYIGTEHLLLGLIREGEGVAARVLVALGADLAVVRRAVIDLLSGYAKNKREKQADARSEKQAQIHRWVGGLLLDGELDRLADLIYAAWWNGTGHVCAEYRCEDCVANARVAASVALAAKRAA